MGRAITLNMETKTQIDVAEATRQVIAYSTGSPTFTRACGINPGILCTEGVMGVAETARAFWLIDIVGSLKYEPRVWAEMNQHRLIICKLKVNLEESTAVFTATQMATGEEEKPPKPIYTQKINYTDFPLEEMEMWIDMQSRASQGEQTLFLPLEY